MAKKLWGGRFSKKTDPVFEIFSRSIHFDYKLAYCDVWGSLLHLEVLYKSGSGVLSLPEYTVLKKNLHIILGEIGSGKFRFNKKAEDIHTNIQNELEKKAGSAALKLHTYRSRNDQVVFDTKLFCKIELPKIIQLIQKVGWEILRLKEKYPKLIFPGFTHFQHAQPVACANYLQALFNFLGRDVQRIKAAADRITLTLGSGALAGVAIDSSQYTQATEKLAKEFGVRIASLSSSIDSVSDRDFIIDVLSVLSILQMHLSRIAEDFIIWSSPEFGFVDIAEEFCTGSSLMPQKKNPDSLELIRGNTGKIYGNLMSVLTMMKGLPLTYNRDMQLDKEPLFNSFEIVSSELKVLTGLIKTLKFNETKIKEQLKDEGLYATDIVYYLVDKKVPFKDAHTIVGRLVKYSLDNDIPIKNMAESLLKKFSVKLIKKEIVKLFDPKVSVESKKSIKR